MTEPEFTKLVEAYELHAPVTVDDCRDIYKDLKPRLPAGSTLDVQMRGLGSEQDRGPLFVEVVVNAHSDRPSRRTVTILDS